MSVYFRLRAVAELWQFLVRLQQPCSVENPVDVVFLFCLQRPVNVISAAGLVLTEGDLVSWIVYT